MTIAVFEDLAPLPGTTLHAQYSSSGRSLPPVYRGSAGLAGALAEGTALRQPAVEVDGKKYVHLLGAWYCVAPVHRMRDGDDMEE